MKPCSVGVAAIMLFLSCLPSQATADAASKSAKIAELMKVTGLLDIVIGMQENNRKESATMREQVVAQLRQTYPEAPSPLMEQFDRVFEDYVNRVAADFSVPDAVKLYGDLYAAQLSEDELGQILTYYESPIGQKDVTASTRAGPLWTAQLAEKYRANRLQHLKDFNEQTKVLMQECARTRGGPSGLCGKASLQKSST